MARRFAALVAVALLAGACHHARADRVVLDGRPRYPDVEGVVQSVSVKRIVLDGGRSYAVSPNLQSFSTYTLETTPLLGRLHQYVQVGLQGHTAVWVAGVGAVVRSPSAPPAAYYLGHLVRVQGRRAVFRDGTVLRLGTGVTASPGQVRVEIDPDRHVARAIVAG
ncbi:MAG: hypothetical protein QOJ09_2014 [Actinomycetota bacterium]|nr:hypothetical protein [Actinomycetota bacterium]